MKAPAWILITALLVLWMPLPLAADKSASSQIKWSTYSEAEQKGNAGRKYLIYFYTDQCPACEMMKKTTFSDKTVIDYINANYTPVRVNAAKAPELASRFRILGVPDLRFLSPKGKEISRWMGYIDKQRLLTLLQYIETDSYKEISYKDFVEQQKHQ